MAVPKSTILVSSLLLLSVLGVAHESEVVVEGVVYCQSCKYSGTWSLTDSKPIPSAKVSVTCKDYKDRVSFYKVYDTDENGYFYAELEGFNTNNCLLEHPLQACKVKLVASSQDNCNIPTNVNYGLYGSPLRFENKVIRKGDYEAVIFATGPLAYRPSYCPAY